MRYYPVNLDIREKFCLVVGGGGVGTRKVKNLLRCHARVTVVSPQVTDELLQLAQNGSIEWIKRTYLTSDLQGKFLVIGATDDDGLNRQVRCDADGLNMLCNIADRPADCNFILPSIVQRGDLTIAVSTSGKSPAFAKKLRKDLEKQFGEEYTVFLELMGAIRKKLLSQAHEPEAHKPIFEQLISGGLLEWVKEKNEDKINHLILKVLGPGFEMDQLIDLRRQQSSI